MTISKYTFILLSLFFVFSTETFSQENVNNYKYVIIPKRYEFLKSDDQYQLNSLTKFLFNKYGFTAFMEDEDFPEDLRNNRCLALYANVFEHKAFLKTRLQIDLKDCSKKLIHSSKIGESRVKEFEKVFNLALRDAFETFQYLSYKYEPSQEILNKALPKTEVTNTNEQVEIERLKQELEVLKEEQKLVEVEKIAAEKIVTPIELKDNDTIISQQENKILEIFYAQPIDNGFQIVDMTPKKVMVLYYSGVVNTFIVKDRNAIVYKKGNDWVLAENDGKSLKSEVLNIKF